MDAAELQAAFDLNSDFDYPVNVSRARKFVQTCRRMLGSGIAEWQHGNERMRFDLKFISDEMNRAIAFLNANDTSLRGTVNPLASLENFRA